MKKTYHSRYAHRFPAEVISYAVWSYLRFPLSLHMAEDSWSRRCCSSAALSCPMRQSASGNENSDRTMIARPSQAAKPHDVWHLDEVVISIAGKKHWLWRAVDQDDLSWRYECLDIHKRRETGPGPSLCNRPGDQSGGRFPASVRSSEATPQAVAPHPLRVR
jgi:hypothetical protein